LKTKVKLYLNHTPSPSGEGWGEVVRRGLGRGQERVFHPWLFTFDPFRISKCGRSQQESTPCCLNPLRIAGFWDADLGSKKMT